MAQEAEENKMAEISELPSEPNHHQNGGYPGGQNSNGVHHSNGPDAASQTPVPNGAEADGSVQSNGHHSGVESGRRYAQIIGWGYCVPEKVITNHDLEQIVET